MRLRDKRDFPRGNLIRFEHHSSVLEENPWEDPTTRDVSVYLPHDYSESADPYITLWDLAAYTNSGPGHLNWRNQGENLVERLDRLIGLGDMPSVVVVIPDCYTSLGGNQYVNSPSVGRYADYLVQELVPFINGRLNVAESRNGRGLFGKSSGGYGALYHVMQHPDTWGAAASLAGDVGFELVYKPEFPLACQALAEFGGDSESFMRSFWQKNRPLGRDYTGMMILAMAASYDPDPRQPCQIRLPFDLRTCEIIPERWDNWLRFDPLNLVEQSSEALKSMHAIRIDVGVHDQYNIQYGSRRLADRFKELGIDYRYEEFDGSHSSIDWRLDHSLPYLAQSLKNTTLKNTLRGSN
jgi:enterochelin esterase-like enzyme